MFDITIYYINEPDDYIYGVLSIGVLANGFFRIETESDIHFINPSIVERIETTKLK